MAVDEPMLYSSERSRKGLGLESYFENMKDHHFLAEEVHSAYRRILGETYCQDGRSD